MDFKDKLWKAYGILSMSTALVCTAITVYFMARAREDIKIHCVTYNEHGEWGIELVILGLALPFIIYNMWQTLKAMFDW